MLGQDLFLKKKFVAIAAERRTRTVVLMTDFSVARDKTRQDLRS